MVPHAKDYNTNSFSTGIIWDFLATLLDPNTLALVQDELLPCAIHSDCIHLDLTLCGHCQLSPIIALAKPSFRRSRADPASRGQRCSQGLEWVSQGGWWEGVWGDDAGTECSVPCFMVISCAMSHVLCPVSGAMLHNHVQYSCVLHLCPMSCVISCVLCHAPGSCSNPQHALFPVPCPTPHFTPCPIACPRPHTKLCMAASFCHCPSLLPSCCCSG